ncbi:hypothetical protein [Flagellimonas onchidii]|uniref:hypothetical protein n=1 Tax=Flagellimonas onchidii TaxID=2562684 RepID=UPI0010A63D77|nr:hypothetical protein [Allomuricauda onchidii]
MYAPPRRNMGIMPTGGGIKPKPTGVLGKLSPTVSVISTVLPMFQKLVSGQVFSKTIGQLKDGFDCWNSTWTPSRAKNELPQWMENMAMSVAAVFNGKDEGLEKRINDAFAHDMWQVSVTGVPLYGWIGWRYDTAKDCTLRGLKKLEEGTDAYIPEIQATAKASLSEMGYDVTTYSKTVTFSRYPNGRGKKYNKTVPQFRLSKRSVLSDFTGGSSGGGSMLALGLGAFMLVRKFIK